VRRTAPVLALVGLVVAGCGGGSSSDQLGYDEGAALELHEGARTTHEGVVIQDISYASGDDRVEAYLLTPPRTGRRLPAVVFLHGAGGDRSEQLDTAVELASRGAITLTITAPSRKKPAPSGSTFEELVRWQGDTTVADVTAARRAFDVLEANARVDGDRLGLVGWSMGGRLAAIVAGVDDRARATVLMSVGARPVSEYVDAAPADLRDVVQEVLEPIDPLTRVDDARGALFVQAGRLDSLVPRAALQSVIDAAPEGTKVEWYPADHPLDGQARADQLDWLAVQLRIEG
jgi:dienelactone hydrolase